MYGILDNGLDCEGNRYSPVVLVPALLEARSRDIVYHSSSWGKCVNLARVMSACTMALTYGTRRLTPAETIRHARGGDKQSAQATARHLDGPGQRPGPTSQRWPAGRLWRLE